MTPHYWPFVRGITHHREIPLTKASDAELWYFLWSAPEQTVEQTIVTPVIYLRRYRAHYNVSNGIYAPIHHNHSASYWLSAQWGYNASRIRFDSKMTLLDYNDVCQDILNHTLMTSSNGNIFRVTGPLCGEFTGHRWIPLTKASDADLWCFLWYAPEQTVE